MAAVATTRISKKARRDLKEIAAFENVSMTEVLEHLIERRRRRLILQLSNEHYAKVRDEDPETWSAFRSEVEEWDSTSGDGLDED